MEKRLIKDLDLRVLVNNQRLQLNGFVRQSLPFFLLDEISIGQNLNDHSRVDLVLWVVCRRKSLF